MTKFEWISDRQVVATDIDENGVVTIIAAEVQPNGAFEIVHAQSFETNGTGPKV